MMKEDSERIGWERRRGGRRSGVKERVRETRTGNQDEP
jgi:hypothetical protein